MTVRENLDLGAYLRRDDGITTDRERVYELFPRLKERERQKAGHDVRAASSRCSRSAAR